MGKEIIIIIITIIKATVRSGVQANWVKLTYRRIALHVCTIWTGKRCAILAELRIDESITISNNHVNTEVNNNLLG